MVPLVDPLMAGPMMEGLATVPMMGRAVRSMVPLIRSIWTLLPHLRLDLEA